MPLALKNIKEKPKPISVAKAVQQKLQAKVDLLKQLEVERHQLLNREQILWQGIDQQECVVYHLGLLLSEELSRAKADGDDPDSCHVQTAATLAAMLNDVRALQMKSGVGSGPSSGRGTRRLYTSQLLFAAITPENVAYIKAADIETELIPRFRKMTMRLSYLLTTSVDESLLSDSLSEKVDEYSELVQLLHTAADDKLLALGLYNFETMQQEFPPAHHWDFVCERVGMRPEQEEELAIGFNWYAVRRTQLIKQLDESVQKLQQLMGLLHGMDGQEAAAAAAGLQQQQASDAAAASFTAVMAAAAPLQEQQQAVLDDTSREPLPQLDLAAQITSHGSNTSISSTSQGGGGKGAGTGTGNASGTGSASTPSVTQQSGTPATPPAADASGLGVFDLETAEELQLVLADVDRLNRAIREVDRFCVYLSINALDKRQLALSAVYSYPYLVQPPACCEVIARTVAGRHAAQAALAPDRLPTIPVVNSDQLCEALPNFRSSGALAAGGPPAAAAASGADGAAGSSTLAAPPAAAAGSDVPSSQL